MSTRRRFLAVASALVAACTGRGSGADDTSVDTGPADSGAGDDSGAGETCPMVTPGTEAQGWTPLALAVHPEIANIYSGKQMTINGTTVNVAQVGEGCFVTMGVVCTHSGCTVAYRDSRNQFVCPCHGAIYGVRGETIAGPAPLPLPTYPTGFDGTSVWVLVSG